MYEYKASFILTKWYVKVFGVDFPAASAACFILTKWYVKIGWTITAVIALSGFILTKWYVKLYLENCCMSIKQVLY
ncbi:Uncharacterised protein [Clostridioides difficile]|nr:Uncharacterised protein [Clostridioides difficile]